VLQVIRSRGRFAMVTGFFNLPHPSRLTTDLRLSQPLTELSIRNVPEGKERPVCKTENPTANCEPIV
jgi:hypothetical protein